MSENQGPTCATCLHCYRDSFQWECRINPPERLSDGSSGFPPVNENRWCSKHPDRVVAISLAMAQYANRVQADRSNIVVPKVR